MAETSSGLDRLAVVTEPARDQPHDDTSASYDFVSLRVVATRPLRRQSREIGTLLARVMTNAPAPDLFTESANRLIAAAEKKLEPATRHAPGAAANPRR